MKDKRINKQKRGRPCKYTTIGELREQWRKNSQKFAARKKKEGYKHFHFFGSPEIIERLKQTVQELKKGNGIKVFRANEGDNFVCKPFSICKADGSQEVIAIPIKTPKQEGTSI